MHLINQFNLHYNGGVNVIQFGLSTTSIKQGGNVIQFGLFTTSVKQGGKYNLAKIIHYWYNDGYRKS